MLDFFLFKLGTLLFISFNTDSTKVALVVLLAFNAPFVLALYALCPVIVKSVSFLTNLAAFVYVVRVTVTYVNVGRFAFPRVYVKV